ncbi:hypothetical protein LAG90_12085 [Marinilongibacter aquaticus]|uniref:hypothetical protein n=1 Tax=Marinilongibacter aquaticus TaxID=2975157 RepID=UPI0021BDCEE9|nr:hypothetical protein [Marinilongibacter aquaticus]UBM57557.1 hypothetical protein LAG90_12085 [Marinilongibacter aquaticus]
METGKVDLIYEKKPTHTRGKQGNEYTGGQIFKLIDVIGDERFTIGNFLGYKPHTDKSVSPYLKDIEKMKVLFDLKNGFGAD